jgi:hypothetical protein
MSFKEGCGAGFHWNSLLAASADDAPKGLFDDGLGAEAKAEELRFTRLPKSPD